MSKLNSDIKIAIPSDSTSTSPSLDDYVVKLGRGGYIVKTSAGSIQFGIPPESIKDAVELGIEVPQIYVIGQHMFDRHSGVTVAEIEFPTYYNFFIKKRKTVIIAPLEVQKRIRLVFHETLFGPSDVDWDLDFDPSVPQEQRPIGAEHRNVRLVLNEDFNLDNLIKFVPFDTLSDGTQVGIVPTKFDEPKGEPADKEMEVDVDSSSVSNDEKNKIIQSSTTIKVLLEDGMYAVIDGTVPLVEIPEETKVSVPKNLRRIIPEDVIHDFEPPLFGITVLGSSHGFDPKAKTTGFVLWMNGRGLMVDPPLNSSEVLHQEGIPSYLIDAVIVTHCHADHDGGTFQKLLEQNKIQLITTNTIMKSFLNKYTSISGLRPDFLRRLFTFRPAVIGQPLRVWGGELQFFYSVHTLPTIGFVAYFSGKSIYYSSDMCYDKGVLNKMVENGVMTSERAHYFLHNDWSYNVILHEAGIPPIHSPIQSFIDLPDHVKARLYLVHIAAKDIPKGVGLRGAPAGVQNTIAVAVSQPEYGPAIRILSLFESIDIFRNLPIARAREMLQVAETESYPAETVIIRAGSVADKFYVVERGTVEIHAGDRVMVHDAGTWFGETALIRDAPRSASVIARTQVTLVSFRKHEFLSLLRGTDIVHELIHLADVREQSSWQAISANKTLAEFLSSKQRIELQSILERVEVKAMSLLWSAGSVAEAAYIIDDGTFRLILADDNPMSKPNESPLSASVKRPQVRARPRSLQMLASPSIDEGFAPSSLLLDVNEDEISTSTTTHPPSGSGKRTLRHTRPYSQSALIDSRPWSFGRGAMLAEVSCLMAETSTSSMQPQEHEPASNLHQTTVVAASDGVVFKIKKDDMLNFFTHNPGLKVAFLDRLFLE